MLLQRRDERVGRGDTGDQVVAQNIDPGLFIGDPLVLVVDGLLGAVPRGLDGAADGVLQAVQDIGASLQESAGSGRTQEGAEGLEQLIPKS